MDVETGWACETFVRRGEEKRSVLRSLLGVDLMLGICLDLLMFDDLFCIGEIDSDSNMV